MAEEEEGRGQREVEWKGKRQAMQRETIREVETRMRSLVGTLKERHEINSLKNS